MNNRMNIMSKRAISMIAILSLIVCLLPATKVSAAIPEISTSCYMKTYGLSIYNDTPVYVDANFSRRGTAYPKKYYNATIYATDEIYVYSMSDRPDGASYVSYPTSTGRRYGYVRTSALSSENYSKEVKNSRTKITTYKRPGGASYGSISKGDSVYPLAQSGSYTQVCYNLDAGGYKMAWIRTSDYNNYIDTSSYEENHVTTGDVTYAPYTGVAYWNAGLSYARQKCLDKAKQLCTIQWTAPVTFRTWQSGSGAYNVTYATDGSAGTYFYAGKTYTGVPYSMADHSYDDVKWASLVRNGFPSGYMTTVYGSRNATTAHGIDCSYLTYLCFNSAGTGYYLPYQTTSRMLNSSYYSRKTLSTIKGGDIALSGGHVMLFVGRSGNNYAFIEADANDSRVCYNVYSASQLRGYGIYKFNGFSD